MTNIMRRQQNNKPLGYKGRKSCMSAAWEAAKREEKQRERKRNKSTDKLLEPTNKKERWAHEKAEQKMKKRTVTPIKEKQKKQQAERK